MDEHEENFKDIFRYTDVEYTPDGYTDVYRWDDFLVIAGDHVYSAMDTIDSVSPGGEYEGSTRNMPTPARSSGAAICSTAARCSVRCPTTGRTIPKSPSCAATSTIPPGRRQARHRSAGAHGPRSAPDPQGRECRTPTQRAGRGREGRGDQDGVRRDRRREAYLGFTLPVAALPIREGLFSCRGVVGSIFSDSDRLSFWS